MPDLTLFTAMILVSRFDGTTIKKGFGFYNFGFLLLMSQVCWVIVKLFEDLIGGEKINFVDHINLNWQTFGLFALIIGLENLLIYAPRSNIFTKFLLGSVNFLVAFIYAGFFYLFYKP